MYHITETKTADSVHSTSMTTYIYDDTLHNHYVYIKHPMCVCTAQSFISSLNANEAVVVSRQQVEYHGNLHGILTVTKIQISEVFQKRLMEPHP